MSTANATFNDSRKGECLDGTRVDVRGTLQSDLKGNEFRLLWLTGSPGTGKSAIAKSTCTTLESNDIPVISFFFDKNNSEAYAESTKRFANTLAYQLALVSDEFLFALLALDLNPEAVLCKARKEKQLQELVIGPGRMVKNWPGRVVVVLDALDECGNREALKELIGLVKILLELPRAFVFFISCRDVEHVHRFFNEVSDRRLYSLDEIGNKEEDLEKFVQHELSKIPPNSGSGGWPPEASRMNEFARACGGLFEIVAIRLRQMNDDSEDCALQQIEVFNFNGILEYASGPPRSLVEEYRRIVSSAYTKNLTEERARNDKHAFDRYEQAYKRYRLFVGVLITVLNPLTLPELASLLHTDADQIRALLRHLSPVMMVWDERTPFKFYHATFLEFLLSGHGGEGRFPICFNGPQHFNTLEQCLQNFEKSTYGKTMWLWHLVGLKATGHQRVFRFLKPLLDDLIKGLESMSNSNVKRQYILPFCHASSSSSHFPAEWHAVAQAWSLVNVCSLRLSDKICGTTVDAFGSKTVYVM
jgi:hypothetical protein